MKEFLLSLLAVSVAGTLIAAIFPDGELKKPLTFLCGAATAAAFLALFLSIGGKMPEFPELPEYDFSDVFNGTVADSVSSSLSSSLDELIRKETGKDAVSDISVSYSCGELKTEHADVRIADPPENMGEKIGILTGLEVMIHGGLE